MNNIVFSTPSMLKKSYESFSYSLLRTPKPSMPKLPPSVRIFATPMHRRSSIAFPFGLQAASDEGYLCWFFALYLKHIFSI
jgi:hypothetical protein